MANQEAVLYAIYGDSDKYDVYATREWAAYAKKNYNCADHSHLKPGLGSLDVDLMDMDVSAPLANVYGTGLGIIRKDFLEALGGSDNKKNLLLGEVFLVGENGIKDKKEDWNTYRPKNFVNRFGKKARASKTCKDCKRQFYTNYGTLVYPAPHYEIGIYGENLTESDLVVTPSVFEKINSKKWTNLLHEKLTVLDKPLENLEIIPEWKI